MFNCLFDFNILQTFLNVPVSGHFLIHTQETNFHPSRENFEAYLTFWVIESSNFEDFSMKQFPGNRRNNIRA